MTPLDEVIERLEKADGPSIKLDTDIGRLLPLPDVFFGLRVTARRFHLRSIDYETEDGAYHTGAGMVPHFTASIDAALTLVPNGWDWCVYNSFAQVLEKSGKAVAITAFQKHPAIALCIAALKARENEE